MSLASSHLDRADAPLFVDGLGERRVAADATTGELLQILRIRSELTAVPSLEFALRERTARLMNFRHAYYARVRRVDRAPGGGLAIVSDHVEGTRLSDLLRGAHQRGLPMNTNAAVCLIRQLVHAVALLHENVRDASHGLVTPERLVITPHARLVVVEHVLGSAIEQLQFGRERLWQEFRLAIPSSAGAVRFDHRSDVNGIGVTALSLILGRPIAAEEFPHAIPQLLMQARERSPMGDERPLANGFRNWLGRTLQLDVRRAFASAPEALAALEETLASDSSYASAPVALETFLARVHRSADRRRGGRHDADAVDRGAVRAGRLAQLHAASRQRCGRPRRRSRPGGAGAAHSCAAGRQPVRRRRGAPGRDARVRTAGADARRADRGRRPASRGRYHRSRRQF